MDNTALELNPRYMKSGFSSQASNISKYEQASVRKVACYMQTVSQFILKHGNGCFASTRTLTATYNENAPRYGVRAISERTLATLQANSEKQGLINVSTHYEKSHGQRRRLINFNYAGICKTFSAVYKWAENAARNFCGLGNLQDGGGGCGEPSKLKHHKASRVKEDHETCTTRSKIISKDININNASRPLSKSDFFIKYFGSDANECKSLQDAARQGVITANGARKLIGIHHRNGYPLAKRFIKFLNHVIAKEHAHNKSVVQGIVDLYGRFSTSVSEAIELANQDLIDWAEADVALGRGKLELGRNGVLSYKALVN